MTNWRRTRGASIAACSVLFFSSGCVAVIATAGDLPAGDSASDVVSAGAIAAKTEQHALDRGFDLDVDCGEEEVPLAAGTSIECSAEYRVEGTTSLLTVTIATVSDADYTLTVVGFGDPVDDSSS